MVPSGIFDDLVVGRRLLTIVHAFEHSSLSNEDLPSPHNLRGGSSMGRVGWLRYLLVKVLSQHKSSDPDAFLNRPVLSNPQVAAILAFNATLAFQLLELIEYLGLKLSFADEVCDALEVQSNSQKVGPAGWA